MPTLRHIANLWTLWDHPSAQQEWTLDAKLEAISDAGFDGVCWAPSPELRAGCDRLGLIYLGGMASSDPSHFGGLLRDLRDFGARHVNVQLAKDTTESADALRLAVALFSEAKELGLKPAIETHRGTCTETPEKTYALADAYERATGELLQLSFDFSHFAVVKHLAPENFIPRLLNRPELVQRAHQFHFRPFNGHHAQVPVTTPEGALTPEMQDWLPFAEAVLRYWLETNAPKDTELFICPELGPVRGGYALSSVPSSWQQAITLRKIIDTLWRSVLADYRAEAR